MLKYVETATTFAEFPDEIALSISISNCPCKCEGCSESYLAGDIGKELSLQELDNLISKHPGITLVGFIGGDADHSWLIQLASFVHNVYNLKVGFYSGRDYLDLDLIPYLDYYKIGEFRMFKGPEETWKNQTAGPINLSTSNQVMFKKENGKLINITDKFRKIPVNDWKKTIL